MPLISHRGSARHLLFDLTTPQKVSLDEVGGKAFNLHRLVQMGLPVPPAIAISATLTSTHDKQKLAQLRKRLKNNEVVSSATKFAVRSSGVGEDGTSSSCAGIFDSYLNIPKEEVYQAIIRVWESLDNSRSNIYCRERAISIDAMGVVVQHMIEADYAGVAFSVNPIEKDDRIALIEVVTGNGESLVASTKTPAMLRVNKRTGMVRVQRSGADNLPAETLKHIAIMLMPLITQIEDEYKIPVDIEWAIAHNQPYILQARPITA